jgi:hypothetical protein
VCSHLVNDSSFKEAEEIYDKLLAEGKDPGQFMIDLQRKLQINLHEKLPDRNKHPDKLETCGEVYDWIRDQKTAIDDEYSELISAIPGVNLSEKDRTPIWKKWKSSYNEIRNKKMTELTQDEMIELLFEKIDIVHFDINVELALGLDAKTRFILYVLKNLENIRRYENNY